MDKCGSNLALRFVVDVHTTCFGLHGHLQVYKIFYFLVLKESAFVAFVACYIMQFLICVCFCCVFVKFNFHDDHVGRNM
jgi:hypothetical protein